MSPPEWTNWQHTTLAPDPQEFSNTEPPPFNRPDVPLRLPQPGHKSTNWVPAEGWATETLPWLAGPNKATKPRAGQPMEITDDEPEPK